MSTWNKFVYYFTVLPRMKKLQLQLPPGTFIAPCGSRYVCDPAVITTDVDFLVFSEEKLGQRLLDLKFKESSRNYAHDDGRTIWRKGVVNLTVATTKEFANHHIIATHICKKYNVIMKWHRIVVHEVLRGRNYQLDAIGKYTIENLMDLEHLLESFKSPYRGPLIAAYRIQNNIKLID